MSRDLMTYTVIPDSDADRQITKMSSCLIIHCLVFQLHDMLTVHIVEIRKLSCGSCVKVITLQYPPSSNKKCHNKSTWTVQASIKARSIHSVVVWHTRSTLVSINEVNLCRVQLVLRLMTVSGFSSWCRTFISVCNQPPRPTQSSITPGSGNEERTSFGWEGKGRYGSFH